VNFIQKNVLKSEWELKLEDRQNHKLNLFYLIDKNKLAPSYLTDILTVPYGELSSHKLKNSMYYAIPNTIPDITKQYFFAYINCS